MVARNPWAAAIRAAIKASPHTLDELAAMPELGRSQLYSWQNPNGYKPRPEKLAALAKALGVPESALTGEATYAPDAAPQKVVPENKVAHRAHRHFIALHEKASAEQRLWLAQFMVETLEADLADLRELLSLPAEELSPPIKAAKRPTAGRKKELDALMKRSRTMAEEGPPLPASEKPPKTKGQAGRGRRR